MPHFWSAAWPGHSMCNNRLLNNTRFVESCLRLFKWAAGFNRMFFLQFRPFPCIPSEMEIRNLTIVEDDATFRPIILQLFYFHSLFFFSLQVQFDPILEYHYITCIETLWNQREVLWSIELNRKLKKSLGISLVLSIIMRNPRILKTKLLSCWWIPILYFEPVDRHQVKPFDFSRLLDSCQI